MTVAPTRTHILIGFANPFLICEECGERVPYWHDPNRCGCDDIMYNSPCGHKLGTLGICPSWSPVNGCNCSNKETHDK